MRPVTENERNCISYWFPKVAEAGLPVPETFIIRTTVPLTEALDGHKPLGWDAFITILRGDCEKIGLPCFMRTGQGSNKHDWSETCLVTDLEKLPQQVFNLIEWSAMVDFMGLPTDVWAVRKLLKTTPAFYAFHGHMPITREFRIFSKDGEEMCNHAYWPPESIEGFDPSEPNWKERLEVISSINHTELEKLQVLANRATKAVGGAWSVDFLEAEGGWYLIDMAEAASSYHWPSCPNAPPPRMIDFKAMVLPTELLKKG